MTVHMDHLTLVSDAELERLRVLVDAARLTLREGDWDHTESNLARLEERLHALATTSNPSTERVIVGWGSVPLSKVGSTRLP